MNPPTLLNHSPGHYRPQPHRYQYQPQAWGNYHHYAQGWNHPHGNQGWGGRPAVRGWGHTQVNPSSPGPLHHGGMRGYQQPAAPQHQQQQAGRRPHQIIQIGEGMTVAGQSTEGFTGKPRVSLCYQCCKNIPLRTLLKTRDTSCSDNTCKRTGEAELAFVPMPEKAASICEAFQTFLQWWMEKVDFGVDATIEKRARARVQEIRDDIPDAASASASASLSSSSRDK